MSRGAGGWPPQGLVDYTHGVRPTATGKGGKQMHRHYCTLVTGFALLGGMLTAGGVPLVNAASIAPATSTMLDYTIHQGPIIDVVSLTETSGELTGTGMSSNHCMGTITGLLIGGHTNFTLTFTTGPCSGIAVTFVGLLTTTGGRGTWTDTQGASGVWLASDPTSADR